MAPQARSGLQAVFDTAALEEPIVIGGGVREETWPKVYVEGDQVSLQIYLNPLKMSWEPTYFLVRFLLSK